MVDEIKNDVEPEVKPENPAGGMSPAIKISLIVVIVMALSVGAFFVAKIVLLPKYQKYKEAKELAEIEKHKNEVPTMGLIHIIDNITVNTLGSGGRRYVIAEVALEVSNQSVIDEIIAREPQIRDEFIRYLRRQTAQNVLDLGFQERSRRDITGMLNAHLNTGKVDSMYYVKLLLQ